MIQDISVDFSCRIPNNVGPRDDPEVRVSMEEWHRGYMDWWRAMGPEGFQSALVYLRTTVGINAEGWAKFDYVRMPAYRWAVLLAPQVPGRRIAFGGHKGEPTWQDRLVLWALQCYAPIVAADLPDGLVIEVTGCRRYHRLLTLVCSTIF